MGEAGSKEETKNSRDCQRNSIFHIGSWVKLVMTSKLKLKMEGDKSSQCRLNSMKLRIQHGNTLTNLLTHQGRWRLWKYITQTRKIWRGLRGWCGLNGLSAEMYPMYIEGKRRSFHSQMSLRDGVSIDQSGDPEGGLAMGDQTSPRRSAPPLP